MAGAINTFVRDSLGDNGDTPNWGALNGSPDIIPQLAPCDPSKVQQTYGLSSYGQDLGVNIEIGQTNYMYMRAKNPMAGDQTVNIGVYWSSPGMLIQPQNWKPNLIGGLQQLQVPARSVIAAPMPALWTPAQLPTGGHYCLILALSWSGLPPIPNTFPNIDAWWTYCRQNNTIAQRNIDIIDTLPNNRVERWLDLLNPDPQPRLHTIEATCNVPIGSTVTLYCPSPSLVPTINVTGNPTPQNPYVLASSNFPANFQGTLQMIFQPPGSAQPGQYSIVIQQFSEVNSPLVEKFQGTRSQQNGNLVLLGSYIFEIEIMSSNRIAMKKRSQ